MGYLKFKANKLFNGFRLLNDQHVLITDDDGKVLEIVLANEAGDDVQQLNGIISPGFVNCHCHLELSHLKNVIPPQTGLIEFLCSVVTKREASPFDRRRLAEGDARPSKGGVYEDPVVKKMHAIIIAEKEMFDNGIVAVGDIGNTADTSE